MVAGHERRLHDLGSARWVNGSDVKKRGRVGQGDKNRCGRKQCFFLAMYLTVTRRRFTSRLLFPLESPLPRAMLCAPQGCCTHIPVAFHSCQGIFLVCLVGSEQSLLQAIMVEAQANLPHHSRPREVRHQCTVS